MATLRLISGRHFAIEIQALDANDQPAPLQTVQVTVYDKPGGNVLLQRVMTNIGVGNYRADFSGTETLAVTADAAFEIAQHDPAVTPTDPQPIAGGVVRVSRPGDASE